MDTYANLDIHTYVDKFTNIHFNLDTNSDKHANFNVDIYTYFISYTDLNLYTYEYCYQYDNPFYDPNIHPHSISNPNNHHL